MRRLVVVVALALAGGCATPPRPTPVPALVVPLAANWTLQGRIGVQSGEQSVSGNVRWQHRPGADELLITSPLGQGVARIVHDGDGVLLEVPNQPPRRAPDAESLTREMLGYALPLSGLVWWVQGVADPASASTTRRTAEGRLARLEQDGWVIHYLQYTADARPRKLLVARKDLEIRLVADAWQVE